MIGKFLSTVIEVAKLPIDVMVDVATLGGAIDNSGCKTKRRIDKVQRKLEEMDD